MNVFIALTLLAAAASACPELLPAKCGPEEMMCPGGMDPQGCPMPDMCMPSKGNFEIQNQEKLIMTSTHLKF